MMLYIPDDLHARVKRELPGTNMSRLFQEAVRRELHAKFHVAEEIYGDAIKHKERCRF